MYGYSYIVCIPLYVTAIGLGNISVNTTDTLLNHIMYGIVLVPRPSSIKILKYSCISHANNACCYAAHM